MNTATCKTIVAIYLLLSFLQIKARTPISHSSEAIQAHQSVVTGDRGEEVEVIVLETKQIVLFYGGFSEEGIKDALEVLDLLRKDLPTHLYIERGFGGSVKDHKKFIKKIKRSCSEKYSKEGCQLHTYLDGQCSSMCTTLFLEGDKRMASTYPTARLGFHRTLVTVLGRTVPIQSKRSMVRYFSKFKGVNERELKRNRDKLFGMDNNDLSFVAASELLKYGFAQQLDEENSGKHSYLMNVHGIEVRNRPH